MAGEQPPRRGITAFRGDFPGLASMLRRSWSANKEQPLLYTESFLRSAFEYPGSSFDLAPSLYGGNDLVGFVAGFPRSVRLEGRDTRLVLNTLLTASVEMRRTGIGIIVWRELLERARATGYEGTINYCVEGDDMNRMMPSVVRLFGLNTQRVGTIEYLVRFLRPSTEGPGPDLSEEGIALFLELAREIADTVSLARTWTEEEAAWQCRTREGAIAVRLEAKGRRGMLTGYVMEVASVPPARVALMEDLLWGGLQPAASSELLQRFLRAAASRGAQTVSCPVLGYASTDPLVAAGFRRSPRVLHAYLTLWNGQQPKPTPSLYIDVL